MAQATIYVNELEVYGYLGVTPEERKIGHRLKIDAEIIAEVTANETDAVSGTINYAEVASIVIEVTERAKCHTLERLCQVIADRLYAEFPTLFEVTLSINKPAPPIHGVMESAGIQMTFATESPLGPFSSN